MKLLMLVLLILVKVNSYAQSNKAWQFAISNSNSSMPFAAFSKLAYSEYNPGFTLSRQKDLMHRKNLIIAFRFSYLFHQHVQHTTSISSEVGYRFKLPAGLYLVPNIGVGIMQSFYAGKVFQLNNMGEYETKKNFGRTQALILLNERLEKQILNKRTSIFIAYQQSLQAPFIKKYVPLLPYNTLLIGISISSKN